MHYGISNDLIISSIDMVDCIWKSPPGDLDIQERDVHVWCAEVRQPTSTLIRIEKLLSPFERDRAFQIKDHNRKMRFVTSRGFLRVLLGRYLSIAPEKLAFNHNPQGKPSLKIEASEGRINFNLSHSGNIIVYGFALNSDIGIDVEALRSIKDMDRIAEEVFTPKEFSKYLRIPIEQRRRVFFRVWTKKEAFTKGLGEGLIFPFDSFEVSIDAGNLPEVLDLDENPSAVNGWCIKSFEPAVNYVGALAVRRKELSVKKWHFKIEEYL